jgi:hypothetical protein
MRPIDPNNSKLTILVGKEGLLSIFGHEHEVSAKIAHGEIATSAPESVEFVVETEKMILRDPHESETSRAKLQATMLGPQVLDADKYPEIHFLSETVERRDDSHWRVNGNLALHGATKRIAMEARLEGGHYRGKVLLKQTDYGIAPIRAAMGFVNVKDEIEIEFDIMLAG